MRFRIMGMWWRGELKRSGLSSAFEGEVVVDDASGKLTGTVEDNLGIATIDGFFGPYTPGVQGTLRFTKQYTPSSTANAAEFPLTYDLHNNGGNGWVGRFTNDGRERMTGGGEALCVLLPL